MEKRRDVFQAIADPTRRDIINLIARQPLKLNAIADNFDSSRPTISQHIKILEECGLVLITQQGRERYCEVKLEKLKEVSSWVDQYTKDWNETLDLLEGYLDKKQRTKKKLKK